MNVDNVVLEEENEEDVEVEVIPAENVESTVIFPYSGMYLERSVPPMRLMVAWRLFRLKAYDSNRYMATVGLDQLCVNVRMDLSVAEIVMIFAMLRECILRIDDENIINDMNNPQGWECCMGIAGSSALLLLEAILKRSYTHPTEHGRWSTGMELWSCNDVDLFLLRDMDYDAFVEVFEVALRNVAEEFGHPVKSKDVILIPTTEMGVYKRMIYYRFRRLHVKLSIIATNDETVDMGDLTESFDISVCKAIYNPFTGLLHAKLSTFWDVWLGRAFVSENKLRFNEVPLSMNEASRMGSTLLRMVKYDRRGYDFYRCNVLPYAADEQELPELSEIYNI